MAKKRRPKPSDFPSPDGIVKAERGRPTKLTPEIEATILRYLRLGNYLETACNMAGIRPKVVRHWCRLGAEGHPRYQPFWVAVERAMAESEVADLGLIQRAAQRGEWTAAAWRLERRLPKRWGRQQRIEHSGPNGQPIDLARRARVADALDKLTPEEFEALLQIKRAVAERAAAEQATEDKTITVESRPALENGNGNGHAPH